MGDQSIPVTSLVKYVHDAWNIFTLEKSIISEGGKS